MVYLKIRDTHGHHDVGDRVPLGEHIFNTLAGFYVPSRNIRRKHDSLIVLGDAFASAHALHYPERRFLLDAAL
jgi:hypothetical protein